MIAFATPVAVLREKFLVNCEWRHVSKFYNVVEFYEFDDLTLAEVTDEDLIAAKEAHKAAKAEEKKPIEEKWLCEFLVWSGSRNHPKATTEQEEGVMKGNWFFRQNGTKKSTDANGFRKLKKI